MKVPHKCSDEEEEPIIYSYEDLKRHIVTECPIFNYKCLLCKESIDIKQKPEEMEFSRLRQNSQPQSPLKKEKEMIKPKSKLIETPSKVDKMGDQIRSDSPVQFDKLGDKLVEVDKMGDPIREENSSNSEDQQFDDLEVAVHKGMCYESLCDHYR